jgi:uncharacterized protein with HEPN domain
MPHEAKKYLWDIQDAASFVIEDLTPYTLSEFKADRRLRGSTLQHLMVVGEACREIRDHYPAGASQLPGLAGAAGMRNIIAHEYSEIDYELVWKTVGTQLIELRDEALRLYESM